MITEKMEHRLKEKREARGQVYVPDEVLQEQVSILTLLRITWSEDFQAAKGRKPRYFVTTYGCQMNERDSEHLRGYLQEAGFEEGSFDDADLLMYNTCCIREHAEHKVFGNVGALLSRKESNPDLMVAVCGCMMQQEGAAEGLYKRFPFVDLVFGTHALHLFPGLLERVLMEKERVLDIRQGDGIIAERLPVHRKEGASAFVTIMYGCNNYCSFCIVPFVRGRERSRAVDDILDDVRSLVDEGVSEVTLLGQNVNSYGNDLPGDGGTDFASLLRNVAHVPGLERIRFMTSHPKDLSPSLIQVMGEESKICNHIHLPVQSGSDSVLKRMNRKYDRARYLSLLTALRTAAPDIEITTDIIVGFPGETEEDFLYTLSLMKEVGFSSAFTFMYSPRPGTSAANMAEQLTAEEKKRRLLLLNETQNEMTASGNQKYIGTTQRILVDGVDRKNGLAFGKTTSFKTVYFSWEEPVVGSYINVQIEGAKLTSLTGRAL